MENESISSENPELLIEKQNSEKSVKYTKIGGFLYVVAVSLVISFVKNLEHFVETVAPIIQKTRWEKLTDPNSPKYHPYLKSLLIFDAMSSSIMLLLTILAVIAFFRKSRSFPPLVIAFIINIFVITLIGYFLYGFVPDIANSTARSQEGKFLILRFLSVVLWIPYFVYSERVKETFVR